MQLSSYITELLYRYECVIVPGFGAFLTQYRSARIDDAEHTFYPPAKTLSFNRQLQTNDGILANYVATVENCSYELALQRIRNFNGTISLELAEGKTVVFENIGEFVLSEERKVIFTPSEKLNFNTTSFGLSSLTVPKVVREQATSVAETPILFTPERQKTTKPYLKYAVVAAVFLAVAGFGGMKLYEGNVKQHNFVERQKADSLVGVKIQEATFAIEDPLPTVTITPKKQAGRYHIVAGAFRIEANADKKVEQLTEKGFSAKRIGENKYGLHQVIYGSFEQRSDALQELRKIKSAENKDAWLLIQDLQK